MFVTALPRDAKVQAYAEGIRRRAAAKKGRKLARRYHRQRP